jgi:hypothetical protein
VGKSPVDKNVSTEAEDIFEEGNRQPVNTQKAEKT